MLAKWIVEQSQRPVLDAQVYGGVLETVVDALSQPLARRRWWDVSRRDASESWHYENAPLLLKADEVAKMLGLGRTKVYDMMNSGELPVVRIGTAVRVPHKALLEWIGENTQRAA